MSDQSETKPTLPIDAASVRDGFELPAVLDMKTAVTLADILKNQTADDLPALVNGAQVARIGTPALQLLCVLAASVERSGRRFILKDPSPGLRCAMAQLGLEDKLSVWEGPK